MANVDSSIFKEPFERKRCCFDIFEARLTASTFGAKFEFLAPNLNFCTADVKCSIPAEPFERKRCGLDVFEARRTTNTFGAKFEILARNLNFFAKVYIFFNSVQSGDFVLPRMSALGSVFCADSESVVRFASAFASVILLGRLLRSELGTNVHCQPMPCNVSIFLLLHFCFTIFYDTDVYCREIASLV
jgi:hypothetical protein